MRESFWPRGNGGNKHRNAGLVLVSAVALGLLAVAACGSVPASGLGAGSGHASPGAPDSSAGGGVRSSQPALCRHAATVTSLVVNRNHGFKVPELEPAFPMQVTVTDPALVRAVARALCGLPDVPRGVYRCPVLLFGTTLTLHFSAGGRPLPPVTVNSSGCETVTGVGPVRRASSPEFWQVLSRAIFVRTPPVLGGDNPGSGCQPPSKRMTKIGGCPGVARPGVEMAAPAGAAAW